MILRAKASLEEPAIDILGLKVEVGGRLLLDLPELRIRHGERVALIGPNGAGKSSLLKVFGGFLPVSGGLVNVLGRRFGSEKPTRLTGQQWRSLRAEIGQIMQGLHLVSRLSAVDNVVLGALARPGAMPLWRSWLRLYPRALVEEAREALETLGLAERLDTRASDLSGGERQKVALARLRLQRTRLILADEPTSALDPSATQMACQALLSAARDATLLTVVHDPALLPLLSERVIALKNGRLMFDLATNALKPVHLEMLYAENRTESIARSGVVEHLGQAGTVGPHESDRIWSTRFKERLFQA